MTAASRCVIEEDLGVLWEELQLPRPDRPGEEEDCHKLARAKRKGLAHKVALPVKMATSTVATLWPIYKGRSVLVVVA